MRKQPLISILVPVYNSEKYLRRFLDSAVQQTYENIEIICIDNLSEDNSYQILKEYESKFPEKIFVYQAQTHYEYVGVGRNLAFQKSHGKYLYFCDSDDIIQYRAIEVLYNTAFTYDSDLVCGYAIAVLQDQIGNIQKYNLAFKSNQRASNEAAIMSGVELWMRLIKRSLFERVGLFPEDVIFDDVAHTTVIQSYARNIRFLQYPVYYYYRRKNSAAGTPSLQVLLSSIQAERYAIQNCNPVYRDAVVKFVGLRIKGNLSLRWQYTEYLIDWAKELTLEIAKNSLIASDHSLYPTLQFIIGLKDEKIPDRLYLSTLFGQQISEERIRELSERAFTKGGEIILIDESNCDLNENPYISDIISQGKYELAEGYFALKHIYGAGGIYLHSDVELVNSFNFCKYMFGFFGFEDEYSYTDKVFGGMRGNEAFRSLLATFTYAWDKRGCFFSLAERITMILTAKYDIPLDGKAHLYEKPVSVLPPTMLVANVNEVNDGLHCISTIMYSMQDSECVTLKRSTLQYLMCSLPGTVRTNGKTRREMLLERELYELRKSNTWKIVQRLRKIGDSPIGAPLKKIFMWIMKIRKMLKKQK